jgi:sulfite reductase beta subunit-like hemoprotein
MVPYIDLERMVSAGAVDRHYRELVLREPLRAAEGYHSERFRLTPEEKAVISNIHTDDYETLVKTVAHWIRTNRTES